MRQPTLFDDSSEEPPEGPIGLIEVWLDRTHRLPAIGVDEAGRGPLAGPVVAAAVSLPRPLPAPLAHLDDSKKLSARWRERLHDDICQHAVAWGVHVVSAERIDAINILEATREAMRGALGIALQGLAEPPRALLVDGNLPLPGWSGPQWALVKGDGRSLQIAAASILAKVTRDRIMEGLDAEYPGYGFARHKGYGTRDHRLALNRLGPSPVHRRTFRWQAPDD